MNRKARALFITHDAGNYGASQSLQLLLRNYRYHEIDLVVRRRINKKPISDEEIREKFGSHICNIHWLYLPFDYCCTYRTDYSLKYKLLSYVVAMLWMSDRHRLMTIIKQGDYDFIHLNSLVLHQIICPDYPFIIHMRDIFDGSNPQALENIKNALGVIFIDSSTKEPFKEALPLNSIVLNNPFDMTAAKYCGKFESPFSDLDPEEQVVFSMVGVLSDKKGTDFVIRSFKKLAAANVRLIIVGCGEKKYEAYCRKLAAGDPRILFWGEEREIVKIYAVSDYILRGEDCQCVGRTIYEGLYAGCHVIIPGHISNHDSVFQYDIFRDLIHFYSPRNESEFTDLLCRLSANKISGRTYRSNVGKYIDDFHAFIKCCLQSRQISPQHQ